MSKHTPGPWKTDAWVGIDPYEDPDGPFVMIGDVHWSPNKVDVPAAIEQTANARLIAAAPELLEALENLLKVHEGEGGTQHSTADMARAAIAKAKGENHE